MPTMEYVDGYVDIKIGILTFHRINYYGWKLINMDVENYAIISALFGFIQW